MGYGEAMINQIRLTVTHYIHGPVDLWYQVCITVKTLSEV